MLRSSENESKKYNQHISIYRIVRPVLLHCETRYYCILTPVFHNMFREELSLTGYAKCNIMKVKMRLHFR